MIRLLLGAVSVLAISASGLAQQPGQPQQPPSGPATLAAFVCQNLSAALAESDTLRLQIADLQKQLADAKKPAETPKP